MIIYVVVLLIGIISSMAGALLGIGGGIIIVPALVMILKVPMHVAIAVSLATIVSTSMLVTSSNIKNGLINLKIGIILELSTSLFAIAASLIAVNLNQGTLKAAFGFFLLFIAFFMYKKPESKSDAGSKGEFSYYDARLGREIFYSVEHPVAAVSISSVAGFLSGLLGIGGGIVKVPILNTVCRIPMKVASATSSMMVGITAAAASFVYLKHGYIEPHYVFFASIGAILGSRIGLYVSKKVRNETIKMIFIVVLVFAAVEMIVKAFAR